MNEHSHDRIVNSTLTELALMLVFVFALFPAVAAALNGGGRDSAKDELPAGQPSCLWIPRADLAHESGATVSYLSPNARGIRETNIQVSENNTPLPRSFLQIYWLHRIDKEISHFCQTPRDGLMHSREEVSQPRTCDNAFRPPPLPDGLASTKHEFMSYLAVVLNPDSGAKPYLFRDERARAGVQYALKTLDGYEHFQLPYQSYFDSSNTVRQVRVLRRSVVMVINNEEKMKGGIGTLRKVLETVSKDFGCDLLVDFYNLPLGNEIERLVANDASNRTRIDTVLNGLEKLDENVRVQKKDRWFWKYGNTKEIFPNIRDETP